MVIVCAVFAVVEMKSAPPVCGLLQFSKRVCAVSLPVMMSWDSFLVSVAWMAAPYVFRSVTLANVQDWMVELGASVIFTSGELIMSVAFDVIITDSSVNVPADTSKTDPVITSVPCKSNSINENVAAPRFPLN